MRRHEITRLEALSDAVFGFAATLLVVALEVPRTYPDLLANLHGFVAFGLSFAMLILIWAAHNSFFRRFGLQDTGTVVLNSILLFVVLFYVYPLKFLATALVATLIGGARQTTGVRLGFTSIDDLGHVFAIYGAGFAAVFLCFVLLYRHASRRAELGLTEVERFDAFAQSRHYGIFVGVALLSIALAELRVGLHYGVPGWVYSLLGPLCWLHGAWSGRRRRALEPA